MKTEKIVYDGFKNQIDRTRHASRGIIIKDNKILLSYAKNKDVYMIPGGGVEIGEDYSDAVIREIQEETSYIVEYPVLYFDIHEYFSTMLHINHYFICKIKGQGKANLTLNEKLAGFEAVWVSLEDAIKIFSTNLEYKESFPEKYGLYYRELEALNEYLNYIKRTDFKTIIEEYKPVCIQEEADKEYMLKMYNILGDELFYRSSLSTHFSASCWITNKEHTKVLMNWHNIYKNWGWLGGHNDGDRDFLNVALKEAMEESGLKDIKPLIDKPISIEILPVTYHMKNGKFISSHTHMNLTYLLEAKEDEQLIIKPDENSGLKWVLLDEAINMTNEEGMKPIYKKLNDVLKNI